MGPGLGKLTVLRETRQDSGRKLRSVDKLTVKLIGGANKQLDASHEQRSVLVKAIPAKALVSGAIWHCLWRLAALVDM